VDAEDDWKRVSFYTRETSAVSKLNRFLQTNKAVRRAEIALG
jgi:hypothetical protein